MPTPLLELQRRLAEAGRIRLGEKGSRGEPRRLTKWRITSPDQDLVEQAAALYGGKCEPWESPTGPQFQVHTEVNELPVLVMPAYSLRQQYEFRVSPTLVERRCDGSTMDDDRPCKCAEEGIDTCDLITRLTVALPELTTLLGWRLESKGDNAARELLGSLELVQGVAAGRPFVPAKLKIVERRGNVAGQATRYVVPVIDVAVAYNELARQSGTPELAYTPAPRRALGVSVADGLDATTSSRPAKRNGAAEIPEQEIEFGSAPVPVPEETVPEQQTLTAPTRLTEEEMLVDTLVVIHEKLGSNISTIQGHVTRNRNEHPDDEGARIAWLKKQIENAEAKA